MGVKIAASFLGIWLMVLGGMAFAMPWGALPWGGGTNSSGNKTFFHPYGGFAGQNGTNYGLGLPDGAMPRRMAMAHPWQAANRLAHPPMMQLNGTLPNESQRQAFRSAVISGDFAAASQLHKTYGLGGPIFGHLNQSTFGTYSKIASLQDQLGKLLQQLRGELGEGVAGGAQGVGGNEMPPRLHMRKMRQ